MNDDKVKPKLSSREKLPANTVKIEDPRYEIFYPNISGYCDGIGYYRSYMYNGAFINTFDDEKNPVRYEIIYQDDTHKRIECMRLTLLYPRAKLGGIFTNLPYGIVKKSVPGIGATTLALNQPRDTIIVLPTKKLAYQKYLRGYNKDRTSNRFLYVGSDIPEENCKSPTDEQIRSYIAEKRTGTFSPRKTGRITEKKAYYTTDGTEHIMVMDEQQWSDSDETPQEFLFELVKPKDIATATVKLYLNDGYTVPEVDPDPPVAFDTPAYGEMIARSCLSTGNNIRIKRVLQQLRDGKPTTIAFLGGSITQGAGAVPSQEMCYARKTYEAICERYTPDHGAHVRYIKAGVGGTPCQLGIIRYDRDITRDGAVQPDLIIVEFAVNDEADETKRSEERRVGKECRSRWSPYH